MKLIKDFILRRLDDFGYTLRRKKAVNYDVPLYMDCYERPKDKYFFNLGAGKFNHPFWTNLDYKSEWYAKHEKNTKEAKKINHDLLSLKDFSIESSCAEVVYTSHTVEHLSDAANEKMFSETYRILKKGGFFRVTTVNIDLPYSAFIRGDRHYFFWVTNYSNGMDFSQHSMRIHPKEAAISDLFLWDIASQLSPLCMVEGKKIDEEELRALFKTKDAEEVFDYLTSLCKIEVQRNNPGFHMNWFNHRKLISMLSKAGFEDVYISAHGQSRCPVLRDTAFFDNTYPRISLYVEAVK